MKLPFQVEPGSLALGLPARMRRKGLGLAGARAPAGVSLPSTLSLQGVTHRFGAKTALSAIDLDVERSEILCLLGHSGCGKSTLLRLIAGLIDPDEGRVLIDGRIVAGNGAAEPPEARGVGMIFQDYALFPHLTNLANVMFGLRKLGRHEARRAALAALARVGLADDAARFPHEMSGGEQQRVALARAIAPRPGALLMDEPFSGLDKRLRDAVRDEALAVLRETRATTILVTHDPEEAMQMASRIALLRNGRLVQLGTPTEVYERPVDMDAARYFTPMTELRIVARDGRLDWPFQNLPAPDRARDGDALDVGIRPEGVEIVCEGEGVPGPGAQRAVPRRDRRGGAGGGGHRRSGCRSASRSTGSARRPGCRRPPQCAPRPCVPRHRRLTPAPPDA